MKTPHIDLEELKKLKEENFKDRLAFIDKYTEWLKKTPNRKWSTLMQLKKIKPLFWAIIITALMLLLGSVWQVI